MNNISKIKAVRKISFFQGKGTKSPFPFKKGEILTGKILEKLNNTNYLIRLKGQNVVAESANSLPKGEEKTFQVLKLEPKVELKLLESKPVNLEGKQNKIELLKILNLPVNKNNMTLLSLIESTGHSFTAKEISYIFSLLSGFITDKEFTKSELSTIKIIIFLLSDKIPLSEKNLELLKNHFTYRKNILSLFENFNQSESEKLFNIPVNQEKNNITGLIGKLISLHENFIQKTGDFDNNLIYTPFPVFWEKETVLGELFIFPDDNDSKLKEKNKITRLVFLLNFEDTGIMKISIVVRNLKNVFITFESKDEKFLAEFKKYEFELKDSLRKKGVSIDNVLFKKIEDAEKAIGFLYSEFLDSTHRKVDLTV